MALSWTMDKLGPIARSVEDCALVLEAIHGPDGKDISAATAEAFDWDPGPGLEATADRLFEERVRSAAAVQAEQKRRRARRHEEKKKREEREAERRRRGRARREYDRRYELAALEQAARDGREAAFRSSCPSCPGTRWCRC